MIPIATGLSIEPPTAWSIRKAISIAERGREAAQQRGDGEDREPGLEHAAAPEAVAGGAAEDQQAREHEGVGVDDPLQARDVGVQLAADRGQGDVDDRVVEPDDQQAHAADDEDQPPAAAVG